jgi:hypothetical protein
MASSRLTADRASTPDEVQPTRTASNPTMHAARVTRPARRPLTPDETDSGRPRLDRKPNRGRDGSQIAGERHRPIALMRSTASSH